MKSYKLIRGEFLACAKCINTNDNNNFLNSSNYLENILLLILEFKIAN